MSAQNQSVGSGISYDSAGNLKAEPGKTYTYDAENRMTVTAGVTYTYDGDGKRLKKSNGKLYWYGTDDNPLLVTDAAGNNPDEYIFFEGKRIARRKSDGAIQYYFADHLGTSRIVVNATGTILDDSDFYPFGGERVITSSSGNKFKFTGKERDDESGLDFFGARYYASSLGRFMGPDPLGVLKKLHENPQDLNLYTYTINNPMRFVDPDGQDWKDVLTGVKEGAVNFASNTLAGLKEAVKNPESIVTGAVEFVKTGVKAYATEEGRGQLSTWLKGMDTKEKVAVVTEAVLQGVATVAATKGAGAVKSAVRGGAAGEGAAAANLAPKPGNVGNTLGRSATSRTTSTGRTITTVKDAAGSTKFDTTPGKTGGQSTITVRKDPAGNVKYVKQEGRTNTTDFNKPPDHVHYKKPIDKEMK